MASSRPLTKILADFLFRFYLLNYVLKHATNHTQHRCATFTKITLKRIINISIISFLLFISCESETKLDGTYSTCNNGLYGELYFDNDSIRLATSLDYVSASRKYEIKNDSLYHYSFGEPEFRVAKINFMDNDAFELYYPKDSVRLSFLKTNFKFDINMDFENFFKDLHKRKIEFDCRGGYER